MVSLRRPLHLQVLWVVVPLVVLVVAICADVLVKFSRRVISPRGQRVSIFVAAIVSPVKFFLAMTQGSRVVHFVPLFVVAGVPAREVFVVGGAVLIKGVVSLDIVSGILTLGPG